MNTLTRANAHQLVDDAFADGTLADMQAIAAHWDIAGHWNGTLDKDHWYDNLHEHVDTCASGDDARSNGPKDSDDSGLTAPKE